MYNPYGGYATFIMPAILIVIIQQTLLIGIGMVGGTWRERGLYKTLIPWGERDSRSFRSSLGKSTAYLSIYCATLLYVMGFHYKVFGYPSNGAAGDVVLFLIPYLLSCTFLGIALSSLFRRRENSLLLLLFTSIPFLMLSGASIPQESMPQWLFQLGRIIPSSSGVDGFIRIRTMGATLSEVSVQFWTLWILSGLYFILACLGMRGVLLRVGGGETGTNEIIRTGKDQPNKQSNEAGLAAFGLSGQIFHAPFIEAHPDFELTAVAERKQEKRAGDISRRRIGRFVRGIAALRRRTDRRQHARRNPLSAVPGRLGSRANT